MNTTIAENDRRDQNRVLAAESESDDGRQRGGGHVHQIVAEQDQTDQAVRALQKFFSEARRLLSGPREMPQPVAVQAHQRGLGAREKRREHEQCDQQAE